MFIIYFYLLYLLDFGYINYDITESSNRYIENPLLISGKKFDLRLYVLVTSFHPLKAYLFKFGFCRFCSVKYNSHVDNINGLFAHLTNVSVQKQGNVMFYFIQVGSLKICALRQNIL